MLKGNLSTRPFYNERLVSFLLLAIAALALGFTAFNAVRLIALSSERSALKAQVDLDEAQAARIRDQVVREQKGVDLPRLNVLNASTREANILIDLRTFSWTTVLGQIEQTLPFDVRLVGVEPKFERGTLNVMMSIIFRRQDDLDTFIRELYKTGSFYDVTPRATSINDDKTFTVLLESSYLPPNSTPTEPKAPVKKGRS